VKVYVCLKDYGYWRKGTLAAFDEEPDPDVWAEFLFE
jgi:hypothetical protein